MRSDVPNSFGIVDTPDARLWGMFTGTNNQAIMVVTDSRTPNSLYLSSYIDYLYVFIEEQLAALQKLPLLVRSFFLLFVDRF